MSPVKKGELFAPSVIHNKTIDLLKILLFKKKYFDGAKNAGITLSNEDIERFNKKYLQLQREFGEKYDSYIDTRLKANPMDSLIGLSRKKAEVDFNVEDTYKEFVALFDKIFSKVNVASKNPPPETVFEYLIKLSDAEPVMIGDRYVFKSFYYSIKGHYTNDEIRLLILEEFDKERRLFEKLKVKFDETQDEVSSYERPRIPENVRVEVWRRDGGKCARCGSREKLEYDHIVSISKGGSNTARNIELLCERHNRSKSNNVV